MPEKTPQFQLSDETLNEILTQTDQLPRQVAQEMLRIQPNEGYYQRAINLLIKIAEGAATPESVPTNTKPETVVGRVGKWTVEGKRAAVRSLLQNKRPRPIKEAEWDEPADEEREAVQRVRVHCISVTNLRTVAEKGMLSHSLLFHRVVQEIDTARVAGFLQKKNSVDNSHPNNTRYEVLPAEHHMLMKGTEGCRYTQVSQSTTAEVLEIYTEELLNLTKARNPADLPEYASTAANRELLEIEAVIKRSAEKTGEIPILVVITAEDYAKQRAYGPLKTTLDRIPICINMSTESGNIGLHVGNNEESEVNTEDDLFIDFFGGTDE